MNEIAQDHGVPIQVSQRKKEIEVKAHELFEGQRVTKTVTDDREKQRLYSEIGRLKMELDWLKKSPVCARRRASRMGEQVRAVADS